MRKVIDYQNINKMNKDKLISELENDITSIKAKMLTCEDAVTSFNDNGRITAISDCIDKIKQLNYLPIKRSIFIDFINECIERLELEKFN